jgi:hypothetical protein
MYLTRLAEAHQDFRALQLAKTARAVCHRGEPRYKLLASQKLPRPRHSFDGLF